MKGILAACFLFLATPAFADQLASTTEVFCGDQVVVVARVDEGTSEDCRLRMAAPCDEEDAMRLRVTVSEVLAVRNSWDTIKFSTYDPALAPRHVGELVGRTIHLHVYAIFWDGFAATDTEPDGPYLHNPTSAALTDLDIGRLYGGKMFIFTLEPWNGPVVEPWRGPGDLYWGGVWSLSSRNWAINTMRRVAGRDCPALLENNGRSFHGTPTADSPYRQALISQVEAQLAHLAESSTGGVIVEQSLGAAREINPDLDEATWKTLETEIGAAAVSMMVQRGSSFDLGLRAVFDTLSTSELRRISSALLKRDFAGPAFLSFKAALESSEIDLGNANAAMADTIKSVLEKHGLKVPP